jgi:regulator of RNase E activity RraA
VRSGCSGIDPQAQRPAGPFRVPAATDSDRYFTAQVTAALGTLHSPGVATRRRGERRRAAGRGADFREDDLSGKLSDEARAGLAQVSTATLTTLMLKRGLRNVYIQNVLPLNPEGPSMVGEAYTLRYIPAREDIDTLDVFLDRAHPQRKAIEDIPPGCVLVMDCRGDASAASAGGILVTRLMKRGAAGLVSDGGLRDSPEIAKMPFPAYCRGPSAPTNIIKHHAVDANLPIGCGGVPVYPGDIIVGDGEGVVVIPAAIAEEVARDAVEQDEFETFVMEQVEAGRSIFGIYPPDDAAREEYKRWKEARSRKK